MKKVFAAIMVMVILVCSGAAYADFGTSLTQFMTITEMNDTVSQFLKYYYYKKTLNDYELENFIALYRLRVIMNNASLVVGSEVFETEIDTDSNDKSLSHTPSWLEEYRNGEIDRNELIEALKRDAILFID